MDCAICERNQNEIHDFLCAACARNATYLLRLEYAQTLLEKNTVHENVKSALAPRTPHVEGTSGEASTWDSRVWSSELQQVELNETKRRIEQTKVDKNILKQEVDGLRAQIHDLKAKIRERKRNVSIIKENVPPRWEHELARTIPASGKATSSLAQLQHKSTASRAMLCREAASLMRLRQRRRQKDASGREQYSIAGLTLPDLREISNVRCADLGAVLGSVAHLTALVAFYLGVRLPAEITVPFKDYPLPTINTPVASYKGRKSDFPGPGSSPSASHSPSASRNELGSSLKPRPLFVGSEARDERLYNFQKNEPQAFNLFVEGISLLAWDIAWLCRSQGQTSGTNTWEEICNMGRNLHQLLVANPKAPSVARLQSDRAAPKRPLQAQKPSSPVQDAQKELPGRLGQNSDLSAASTNLRSPQNELLRSWSYLSWQALATSLRKTLLTEITSAEWEVLQDQEWDDGTEQFDEAVFVKARTLDGQQYDDARSIMTAKSRLGNEATTPSRIPGTSGWTKLKSREKP